MTDQRARFEEWCKTLLGKAAPTMLRKDEFHQYNDRWTKPRWEAWQAATTAAEADKWAAVRRCAELASMADEGPSAEPAIKAEFPEAFK